MDLITALASDEHRVRIALVCLAEPGDAVTDRLLVASGAVEPVRLLGSRATVQGVDRVMIDGIAHPTVKPLQLLRWLCRLFVPEGGYILGLLTRPGTTLEAAMLEHMNVVGIEREASYLPLIPTRLARAQRHDSTLPNLPRQHPTGNGQHLDRDCCTSR